MQYPTIDPVLLNLGVVQIHWYAMMYIGGILAGGLYTYRHFNRWLGWQCAQFSDLVTAIVLGVFLGGRLGYVVFYDLAYYLAHPLKVLAVWQGGMSFHGGLMGVGVAVWFFCLRRNLMVWPVLDLVAIGSTFGLFFGRIGNFINGELYGRVSSVPWAMVFPSGGPLARHPSQLYQAVGEGLVLFGILHLLLQSRRLKSGQLVAVFIGLYGVIRFAVEFYREPDHQLGLLWLNLSLGQWLCMGMMGVGLWTFFKRQIGDLNR